MQDIVEGLRRQVDDTFREICAALALERGWRSPLSDEQREQLIADATALCEEIDRDPIAWANARPRDPASALPALSELDRLVQNHFATVRRFLEAENEAIAGPPPREPTPERKPVWPMAMRTPKRER